MQKFTWIVFLLLFSFFLIKRHSQSSPSNKTLVTTDSLIKPQGALNFLVIGDWGREGKDHQKPVAYQMGEVASKLNADFIVTTGDNIYYNGVADEYDPLWKASFEDIYTAPSLQKNWYAVLGNHDYGKNPAGEVAYTKVSPRWKMPARYYSQTFNINGNPKQQVRMIFIDTNPLVPGYYKHSTLKHTVSTQDSTAQKEWLIQQLELAKKTPSVKWTFVVGHHPLFTATELRRESDDTRAIRGSLRTLFKKYQVDAYICGHDHDLQHLVNTEKTQYFVSGSGSEATDIGVLPISKLASKEYGFMVFSAKPKEVLVQAINHEGKVIYQTSLKK